MTIDVASDGARPDAAAAPLAERSRWRGLAWFPIGLVLLGLAVAVPVRAAYFSNQNQYLLPVAGPDLPNLAADWMLTTVDPYPFFTAVSDFGFNILGEAAFVLGAIAAAICAWGALYLLSRDLLADRSRRRPADLLADRSPGRNRIGDLLVDRNRAAALLSIVIVGLAQLLPLVPNMFGGLANQYILEQPMFYQPAAAGSLVLLGAALALRMRINPGAVRRLTIVTAIVATALGCALHPTYLVATALLLFAAMVIDLVSGRRSIGMLIRYAALVIGFAVFSLALNPAILDVAGGDSAVNARFAFERIPQHTLMSEWGVWSARYVAVVLVAALLWWRASSWFARWLLLSITLAVGLAGVVEITHNATLALAFPARASVILVPLSMAAAGAFVIRWLSGTRAQPAIATSWATAAAVAIAAVLGAAGLLQTIQIQRADSADEMTRLAAAADPAGVGLVPLAQADNVRLNAGAALFVDHKSPPYASQDLAEWFRRLDAAEAAEADVQQYCTLLQAEGIEWVAVRKDEALPECLAGWREEGDSERFRLLVRGA